MTNIVKVTKNCEVLLLNEPFNCLYLPFTGVHREGKHRFYGNQTTIALKNAPIIAESRAFTAENRT